MRAGIGKYGAGFCLVSLLLLFCLWQQTVFCEEFDLCNTGGVSPIDVSITDTTQT